MPLSVEPIAYVRSTRREVRDNDWDAERAEITLVEGFGPEALEGLAEFSHAEIVFVLDQVPEDSVVRGLRHPRGNTSWPAVGIFAQRGKNRPNRIGATIVKVERVESTTVFVRGLDAVDGTPVLDIKPVMREFLPREDVRQPEWVTELMRGYWEEQPSRRSGP
jgi:tRNA (adenine37-N6)-methyltransferase